MPWDYKTNKPNSVKYLNPSIQKKVIAIANAILRNGGDEGTAIAVGIKKAKEQYNKKGLVKLAILMPLGGLAGYAIGSHIGKTQKDKDKNKKIGLAIGFGAGLASEYGIAKLVKSKTFHDWQGKQRRRYYDKQYTKYKNSNDGFIPPPTKSTASHISSENFFKKHGVDHSKIKTKTEAKNIYRKQAMKYHPDKGGDPEKFKELSQDWESVKNSEWFTKLASLSGLIKLASMSNDDVYVKAFAKRMVGKDDGNMDDVTAANKGAKKVLDKYRNMVKRVKIKRGLIGAAIGAGLAGVGLAYKKYKDKKMGLIKLAFNRKENWATRHPLISGGIALTGGIAAADAGVNLYKYKTDALKSGFKSAKDALVHGVKEGGLYGGILAGSETALLNGVMKKKEPNS